MSEEDARLMALLLSVTFVFLIMGVLFSFLPLSIITTIPMAFLGVYWTRLTGTPLHDGCWGCHSRWRRCQQRTVYIDLVTRLRNEGANALPPSLKRDTSFGPS